MSEGLHIPDVPVTVRNVGPGPIVVRGRYLDPGASIQITARQLISWRASHLHPEWLQEVVDQEPMARDLDAELQIRAQQAAAAIRAQGPDAVAAFLALPPADSRVDQLVTAMLREAATAVVAPIEGDAAAVREAAPEAPDQPADPVSSVAADEPVPATSSRKKKA